MNIIYLEEKIRKHLNEANSLFYEYVFFRETNIFNAESKDAEMEEKFRFDESFEDSLIVLSNCIYSYLDKNKLTSYLELFKKDLMPRMQLVNSVSLNVGHNIDGEPYSPLLHEIWNFLSPFEFIEADKIDMYLKQAGVKYLENILNSTAIIVKSCLESPPKTEPEIYKSVKHVITSVFPDCKHPRSNFLKTAKQYHPDVLIPHIHVAIEYKYANCEEKLKNVIDEISIDQKGYTGDSDYHLFYAVFYTKGSIWSSDRFKKVWDEKEFPKNWKYICVVGE